MTIINRLIYVSNYYRCSVMIFYSNALLLIHAYVIVISYVQHVMQCWIVEYVFLSFQMRCKLYED